MPKSLATEEFVTGVLHDTERRIREQIDRRKSPTAEFSRSFLERLAYGLKGRAGIQGSILAR